MNTIFKIPLSYFTEKKFEKGGEIYKYLGIHHFKKVVPFGDYTFKIMRLFNKKANMIRIREHVASYITFTIIIETIHGLFFILMNYLLVTKYLTTGEINFKNISLNLIINVLPILVQRYNRIRLLRSLHLTVYNYRR